jgi:SRSO17 transposase
MGGQCRKLERKSREPMALEVAGGTLRGLQRFRSDVVWAEAQMRWHSHQLVAEAMGAPKGGLRVAETGFGKQGQDSVGGARQYGGTWGQVENGQVGVWAGYASRQGDARVDQRLCLPAVWWTAASAARRARCTVPAALTWQSQPALAAAL